jgi:DNA-binding MarR family transcriptional regulator
MVSADERRTWQTWQATNDGGEGMTRRTRPAAAIPVTGMEDHVDRLLREWSAVRPDLDVAPIAVVYRVTRLAAEWNNEIDRVFAKAKITNTDFAVLANLRRAGPPFQLSQRQIMNALRLTSGTISIRIDKLVERGLVERQPDPNDARASLVTITEAGGDVFDAVAPEHLANEARLVAALSSDEQQLLGRLLKSLLIEIEQPATGRPDHQLGMTVAAAAVGQHRRTAVGLPAQPGLLVEEVANNGPAAKAGIQVGDFVTASNQTPLRSLTCLERALTGHPGPLPLTFQRNGRRHDVVVDPAR